MTSTLIHHGAWRRSLLTAAAGFVLITNFGWGPGAPAVIADDFEIVNPDTLDPEIRTWTALSGSTVEAKFVRLDGENVILAREDGVEFRIPASKLSAADVAYVQARAPASVETEEPAPSPKMGKTSASSKDGEAVYAIYEHANFDAVVDEKGSVQIYPKNQGERIAPPLTLAGRIAYQKHYRGARIIELTPPGDLVRQPDTITLRAKTRDNKTGQEVDFEVTYRFEGNEVSALGRSLGDGTYKQPEMFEIVTRIPQTHDIEPSVEQPERIRILKDYSLDLKGGAGGSRSLNYHSSPDFGGSKNKGKTAEKAIPVGPVWEPRKITVSSASSKAPLIPYVYPGKLLWQGCTFFMRNSNPRSQSESEKVVVTID